MASFGERLKGLRESAGMSQRALAEKSGISQKAISLWEMSVSEPVLSNVQKLCTALGVGCEVFFAAEEQPTAPAKKKPKK